MLERLLSFAQLRADRRGVDVMRIGLALAALAKAPTAYHRFSRLEDPRVLHVPWIESLPVLSHWMLQLLIGVWLVAAAFFLIGIATRWSGLILAGVVGYHFLNDQQFFGNHLLLLLMAVLMLSLIPQKGSTVAYWPVFLLQFLVCDVYFFTALSKLNSEFLGGAVLLAGQPRFGALASVLSIATVVFEFALPVALWTRYNWLAIAAGTCFHLSIALTMHPRPQLVVFSLEMMAFYALFVGTAQWDLLEAKLIGPKT